MTLRRKLTAEEQTTAQEHDQQDQTARDLRAQVPRFATTFALAALRERLPLAFPSVDATPVARFRARSWYTYLGAAALEAATLAVLGAFYIVLHLIDFAPLRAELLARTGIHRNAAGETPFDPVSLFLCCLLRWEKGLGWDKLAEFLAGPEAPCWRQLLGFTEGNTPSGSAMRSFQHALGEAFLTDLCPRFLALLQSVGLLPPHSTLPDSPPEQGLPLAADGMLHEAHASMRCGQVTDSCYQPLTERSPRPCPAREKGFDGCSCTDAVCADRCQYTTPRDPDARLIHYSGSNQEGEETKAARNVYGYRSYAQVVRDDELHVGWTAFSTVQPATTDERELFPRDFTQLRQQLPELAIGEVIADAGVGYGDCLRTSYAARAIPVIAIRQDPGDEQATTCRLRGYDAQGHLLCAHGYEMFFQGVDYQRLRATWVCRQRCARAKAQQPADATCPFRDPAHPLGQVRHVGCALEHPDGTQHERLARLYPYNSDLWKQHYGARKNAVEGRNSQIARLGLKRMWSYGLAGATADIALADLLLNLRTLGRLVQEATLLPPAATAPNV
jgi:hypothetical protein